MSKYDDDLPRIKQVLANYAAMLNKKLYIPDVIRNAEEAILTRGKFPTATQVIRDGKRIIREQV